MNKRPWLVKFRDPAHNDKGAESAYGPSRVVNRETAFVKAGVLLGTAPRLYITHPVVIIENVDTGERWSCSDFGARVQRLST